MTKHKHAELIKAWADGAQIERFTDYEWILTPAPMWDIPTVYRIYDKFREQKAMWKPDQQWQSRIAMTASGKPFDSEWGDCSLPQWNEQCEYRLKPAPRLAYKWVYWANLDAKVPRDEWVLCVTNTAFTEEEATYIYRELVGKLEDTKTVL